MAERLASIRREDGRGRIRCDVQIPADVNRRDWLARVELDLIYALGRAKVQIVPHATLERIRSEAT